MEQIREQFERIKAIEVDDLIYLEQDLDFNEKVSGHWTHMSPVPSESIFKRLLEFLQVSMLFLLCAEDHVRSKIVQQQLFVASHTPTEPTTFLHSWACEIQKTNDKWREILLEALCIIQAKAVIKKLGLNYDELEQRFLPRNPYNALFIHHIVKLLYLVSEQLTVTEAKLLIDQITLKYASVRDFKYRDNGARLEVYLMYWLGVDVLSIGRRTTTNQSNMVEPQFDLPSNLDPIVEYLKQIEKDSLKETVSSVCHQISSKRLTSTEHRTICTDDKQPTDLGMASCNLNANQGNRIKNVDESYKVRKSNAGILLIVNQKSFFHDDNPDLREFLAMRMLETRHGTDKDEESLQNTFTAFGYRIVIRENLIHTDLLNAVRDAVNECVGKDSLIVCILSHGYKGVVYGANSIPVKIEDIENLMTSNRLIGKPKILIVQACQGDVTQQAHEVSNQARIQCVVTQWHKCLI